MLKRASRSVADHTLDEAAHLSRSTQRLMAIRGQSDITQTSLTMLGLREGAATTNEMDN